MVATCAFVIAIVATIHPAEAAGERVFRGRYLLTHSDAFAAGTATFRPAIVLDDGRILDLRFAERRRPDIAPGSLIEVEAVPGDGELLVADGGADVVGGTSTTLAAPVQRDVAVLLFNFSNDRSEPYTRAYARGVAFTNADSVAAYYAEASYGQLTLAGDVFGWYEIPNDNSGCATDAWANAAMAAATADGVSLAGYEHVVFAFPATPGCGWAGLAQLPGRYAWLQGTGAMSLRVFAHELGHNLGTHHASTLSCMAGGSRVALVADVGGCAVSEYGDPFTVMGSASRMHVSNLSRGNAGWLAAGNTLTVTASGDHLLTPVATPGTAVKAIRIARTTDTYLLLEFRQPYGTQFETFGTTSPVAAGVSVRIAPAYTSRTRSYLVDTNPATTTFSDAPLTAGSTLVDPLTGVSITNLSVDASGATVRVTFPGGPSPTPTPAPSPSPSPSPTPPPDGEPPTVPGNLTATPLTSTKIALSWTASTDNVGVAQYRIFRDGALVTTTTATTFTDTRRKPSTTYGYEVVARDAAGNDSPAATAVTTTPAREDTRPPKAPKHVRAQRDGRLVGVRWRTSTDNVGIEGYRVFRNDHLVATLDGTRFEERLPRSGMSPTYRIRAFDASGNLSRLSTPARS
jgi:hypothetical protein